MDPKNQGNQPNPQSGTNPPISDQPINAQQAADLIRQQIQSIHSGQQPDMTQRGETSSLSIPQLPVEQPPSEKIVQQVPSVDYAPHFNPYHQVTNPIVAANTPPLNEAQAVPAFASQSQPTPQTAEPGGTSYRKNYSTFMIPGMQSQIQEPQPSQIANAPQILEPTPSQIQEPQPSQIANVSQAPQTKPMVVNAPGLDPNNPPSEPEATISVAELKERVVKRVQGVDKKKVHHRLKPLIVSLVIGLLFFSVNYNEVAVAQVKQYISPGDSISTPVILDPSNSVDVGPESKIIIPKINLDVPVIYDITGYDESQIQVGLERGVVHYGTTALPGEKGNNVIVGHSSNNYFNSGEYKFAFVLLFRLEKDDTFILHHKGERYIYKVFNKQVIDPSDFSLTQPTEQPVTTLITCTPPGTSWKRLVVQAVQISPNPSDATKTKSTGVPSNIDTAVPGNAPSLWQRITESIF